jgi:hypothetical protein
MSVLLDLAQGALALLAGVLVVAWSWIAIDVLADLEMGTRAISRSRALVALVPFIALILCLCYLLGQSI